MTKALLLSLCQKMRNDVLKILDALWPVLPSHLVPALKQSYGVGIKSIENHALEKSTQELML